MITPKLLDSVAQAGHFAAGLAVVYGFQALFNAPVTGVWFLFAWASTKEFWWDEKYETAEVRGSSLKDWVFYMLGGLIALGSLLIKAAL